jgi:hypothetical protein
LGDAPFVAVAPGHPADLEEPVGRNDGWVGGNVEVSFRVQRENRAASALMLVAQFGGDRRVAGTVEQKLDAAFPFNGGDELGRESLESGERAAEDYPASSQSVLKLSDPAERWVIRP